MFNLNCDLFNVMVFCLMLLKFHSDGSENNFLRNPIKYRDLDVYRQSKERLWSMGSGISACLKIEQPKAVALTKQKLNQ